MWPRESRARVDRSDQPSPALGAGKAVHAPPSGLLRTRTCGVPDAFTVTAANKVPSGVRTIFRCVLYAVARSVGGSGPAEVGIAIAKTMASTKPISTKRTEPAMASDETASGDKLWPAHVV